MKIQAFRIAIMVFALVVPILGSQAFSHNLISQVTAGGGPVTPPVESSAPAPEPSPEPTPSDSPVTPPVQNTNSQQNMQSSNGASNSSSSSSNSSSNSSVCGAARPSGKMELFQINRKGTQATLYFTPNATAQSYHVIFGLTEGDERYGGVSMIPVSSNGVQSITITHLVPRKTYSFKVIPVNGCAAGDSTNWLTSAGKSNSFVSYLYSKKK